MSESAEQHRACGTIDDLPLIGEPLPLELVNTTYVKGGMRGSVVDALCVPEDLDKWFALHQDNFDASLGAALRDVAPASGDHLSRFRVLRRALRALATARTDGTAPSAAAVGLVNRTAQLSAHWDELDPADPFVALRRWGEADPRLVALGVVAQEGVRLLAGASAVGLRACSAPGCVLFFIKSHPRREWCTVGCGNRVRVARYSRRFVGDPPE
ncbi:CGNR zinc finger domain-containing protein [Sphaerimonospora cavernae]|uniref:CGNR zinc finger domain-containing protein n=1 Tax=Sphaerimonospora cavernae TaxID=1740611 RepID=A0ABV6UB75_9ACTN